jgi:hypothetical protein
MKHHKTKRFVIMIVLLMVSANFLRADPELQGRQPALDSQGRFWVYRNGATHPKMPFTPYGWMSDATNLSQVVEMDVESRDHPNTVTKTSPPERDRCIRIKLTWGEATWASVAFISGPDKPPWWGDSNTGRYYNLNALPKKKLVFYARGDKGGEVIKAQIGALGDKPFGDSLANPITSEYLKLTADWTRFEIDLKNAPPSELEKICNGFGIVAERASQADSPGATQFYIDDVYFE